MFTNKRPSSSKCFKCKFLYNCEQDIALKSATEISWLNFNLDVEHNVEAALRVEIELTRKMHWLPNKISSDLHTVNVCKTKVSCKQKHFDLMKKTKQETTVVRTATVKVKCK